MHVTRILAALAVGGYGALTVADPLASTLRARMDPDAAVNAFLAAPVVVVAVAALVTVLTYPFVPSPPRR